MCSCTKFAFEGQNAEKKDLSVKCCLLAFAFDIVALGPVVSLELFVSRAHVASYHACLPTSGFFFGEAAALLRESSTFL